MKKWLDTYGDRDWQTTADGTVRYALLGLGWWTTDLALPAIKDSELCEVTTLISSSVKKAQRLADENDVEYGISYDEFHDGEAADEYDAVYIGTPNAFHLEYVETAAELGAAVLCEKPMESTVERAREMVEVCADTDTPLMVAYRMQTDPAVRRAKELIQDGFIGEPVSVYGANSQPLLEMNPDEEQWRLKQDVSGYGSSVMDLGIYSINTTRFLLDREPRTVQSQMSSHADAFDDVPDERSGSLLTLEGGVKMITTASQNAHRDTQLKITGTEGQIDIRPAFHGEATLHLSRNGTTVTVQQEAFDAEDEMREEFDYFADRVLTGADIVPDGRHGLQDMRIIRAIHQAAESGDIVEL